MGQLIQWFFGYVCAALSGKQVNRFLNLCSRNGIKIWKVTYDLERCVRVHFRLKDFYFLRPFLRKTKTHLRIVKKKGFPFWCHRHPYFKWFPVFCSIAFVIFLYSQTLIWNIAIEGNEAISEGELLEYLAGENITTGIAGNEIDCSEIELKIRKKYDKIGWVSVFVENTNLCIRIRESLYETYNREDALGTEHKRWDLIADRDAEIISMVVRSGTAVVKAGENVKAGQTIVTGTYEVFDDAGVVKSIQQVTGDAKVIGETEYIIPICLTEMEILSMRIAGLEPKNTIYSAGNQKIYQIISFFEENGVIIMKKNVMIESNENSMTIYAHITGRSLMGVHIPVEEQIIHEPE